jgi:hypothetical protein
MSFFQLTSNRWRMRVAQAGMSQAGVNDNIDFRIVLNLRAMAPLYADAMQGADLLTLLMIRTHLAGVLLEADQRIVDGISDLIKHRLSEE